MTPKLRLNLPDDQAKKQRAADASTTEDMAESWRKIFASKLTEADRAKVAEVKAAMELGTIGRNPADTHTKTGRPKPFSKAECLRLHKELVARQRDERLAEMVANTPENYRLITTEAELSQLVADLRNEPIIAVDTETTGVDVYVDVIVGISFTLPSADYHVYIPVAHNDVDRQLDREYVLEELRPIIESASIGKVLFNAIFDMQMFRRHGVKFGGLKWDGMTAMHMLNENEDKRELGGAGTFKLKDITPKYLGCESDTFDTLFGKNTQFADVPLDIALVYAAKDTQLTWQLYEFQDAHMRKMPEMHRYYTGVEVPLLYTIADLEANGYILDLDFAREYGEKLRGEAEELQEYLIEKLSPHHEGEDVLNLNSPQQMKPVLSKEIGKELPNLDAKKTLKPLRKEFEVIDKLLEYKRITKLSGTYIDKLPTKQNKGTKRWHSRFNPMGTVTGRFSSGKDEDDNTGQGFNVQNQPADARKMFVAPPGKVIIGADFKAQEIRCVAYLSGEQVLIDAFDNGKDPYAWVASMYYKKPYHEVYKNADGSDTPERKQFKTVVLAYIYGTSKYGLADQLGTSPADADKLMKDLSAELPRLAEWVKETQDFAAKNGYVWMDGKMRKRRLPNAKLKRKTIPYGKYWDDKYEKERIHNAKINAAMRQGPNARVQGSSSIQTKVTMIEADKMCREKGNGWCLWGSVHDELLFEAPDDFTREDIADVERVMTQSYQFGNVPNGTDIEVMRRWGEGVSVDEWFAQ